MKFSTTPVIRIILAAVLACVLCACSSKPPSPKKPNESKRIPINKTIPIELGGASPE